jgi:hypothetical protein
MQTKLSGWALLVSMALAVGTTQSSFAQEMSPTGQYKEGLALGGWKLYPGVFVGADYDDNFNQTASGTDHSTGVSLRVVPRLTGTYDGGIQKTAIYGVVDARFFNADTIAATAGFTHLWEAMRDLTFNFYGNYTRQTDIFRSALQFNNGAIGPPATPNVNIPIIINPFGNTPGVNPIAYNQFTGGAFVTKKFDQFFVTLNGTAFGIVYDHSDNIPFPFQTSHDGASFWGSARVGYNFSPSFYVFAQGDGIFQRFRNSVFDTNGYRVIGGIGSNDPNSLFRGEVYGGYWAQNQQQLNVNGFGIPTDVNSGVFGGRLSYFPTRYWSIVAQVDETLGMSTSLAPSLLAGIPTRTITSVLQTTYGIAREWSVGARVGYTRGEFIGFGELNNHGWMAGASFNYEIWRNLLLTLDYQYTTVQSNTLFASFTEFTDNRYTAGLTYKY